jgi:hypothetical protein
MADLIAFGPVARQHTGWVGMYSRKNCSHQGGLEAKRKEEERLRSHNNPL